MSALLIQANAMRIPLKNESVHCVITSPPYWGLRDYGLRSLVWGGNEDCEHQWGNHRSGRVTGGGNRPADTKCPGGPSPDSASVRSVCSNCGAWRGSLGLEPLHDCMAWVRGEPPCAVCYVCHLRCIFAEVRRVLRRDGTLWLNIGDSYAGGGNASGHTEQTVNLGRRTSSYGATIGTPGKAPPRLKPKDLVGVPWRVALALQADGFYLRSDILLHKTNPMPESVNGWRWERHRTKVGNRGREQARIRGHFQDHSGDKVLSDAIWEDCPGCKRCEANGGFVLRKGSWRPTKSHEYVLLFSQSATYFCDGESVREASTERSSGNLQRLVARPGERGRLNTHLGSSIPYHPNGSGRNRRSVWNITRDPYPESHFATFPPELPRICIQAGTSEKGCCPNCGSPWVRVVEGRSGSDAAYDESEYGGDGRKTIGWRPSCVCGGKYEPIPAIVFDPFVGSGTTLEVAANLLRRGIGIDLSFSYLSQLAQKRIGSRLPLVTLPTSG